MYPPIVKASMVRQCGNILFRGATQQIVELVKDRTFQNHEAGVALNIHSDLGGDTSLLLPLLSDSNLDCYWHWELIEKLKSEYSDKLHECIASKWESLEQTHPFYLNAIGFLINEGDMRAWKALIGWLRTNHKVERLFLKNISLSKLPVGEVLTDLVSLLLESFSPDFKKRFLSDEYSEDVMGLIFELGLASDANFKEVMQTIDRIVDQFQAALPIVVSLQYPQRRLERTFYLNKGDSISIEEVLTKNKYIFSSEGNLLG